MASPWSQGVCGTIKRRTLDLAKYISVSGPTRLLFLGHLLLLSHLLAHPAIAKDPTFAEDPTFLGNEACAGCHESQVKDWTGSHHDLAMQEANADTVLGDFDNATFVYEGVTTTFFKKAGGYWVNTDNEKGELGKRAFVRREHCLRHDTWARFRNIALSEDRSEIYPPSL